MTSDTALKADMQAIAGLGYSNGDDAGEHDDT
jgi:hypothetical protein